MDEEKQLVRQELERMSANFAERDAALTVDRASRMAAVAGVKEGTGGMEAAVLEAQRTINKLVAEVQLYQRDTSEQLRYYGRRLQSAKNRAIGIELPCQSYDCMMQAELTMVDARIKLWEIRSNCDLRRSKAKQRLRWAPLQSAKRRSSGIGLPYPSYDDGMNGEIGRRGGRKKGWKRSTSSSSMLVGWRCSVTMVSRLRRGLM